MLQSSTMAGLIEQSCEVGPLSVGDGLARASAGNHA